MLPTPSQSKALSTERHLAITANAGSGKTSVIVKRYVNLFLRHPDLTTQNVVAITFTENAASELRMRISKEISERLSDPTTEKRADRARLRQLRDSLPSAFIGTIHGFASRLLRAYPVEANIDAGFTIVTGADQRLLAEDAIAIVFYSALDEAYQDSADNQILHLFRKLGRKNVTNLVRSLLNNRARASKLTRNLLCKNDAQILSFWQSFLELELEIAIAPKTKSLFEDLIPNLKPGVRGQEVVPLILAYRTANGFFESCKAIYGIGDKLITNEGTLNSQRIAFDQLPADLQNSLSEFVSWFLHIEPLLKVCPANTEQFQTEHTEYIVLLRSVFALFDQVLLEYSSTKNGYGLLDFEDLIEKLLHLLDNPTLRDEIANEFRFVMIDEYQDTDEAQFELARRLTNDFSSSNNLAIVGDPKQAIYTFRNADAEVFSQTLHAIDGQASSNAGMKEAEALKLTPQEINGSIVLAESFRMARTPLAAINMLFRGLLSDADTEYSELVHGRQAILDGRVAWICPPEVKSQKSSVSDPPENASEDLDEEEYAIETDLIARTILNIIQGDDSAYLVEGASKIDGNPELRNPEYGDIAILLRSRRNLRALERSLNIANIPYVISKGSGFYAQQEILDITSYLKFLIYPKNDVALASILRSPFFAISDLELFQVANHAAKQGRSFENPISFWQKFLSYAEHCKSFAPSKASQLLHVADQISQNLALASKTSTALLVETIFTETGIFASLQAGPQSQQKIANLEKFLAQARIADQSGFSGLFDFVDRIQYLTDSEEQESQAEVSTDQGAVKIMTVHAAKGLEFPIVILPFLQKKFNFDHQHLLDKELGLQIRPPDNRPQLLVGELIHQRSKASIIAEEKRILYVAMTRARDHLILSCTMPEKLYQLSWLAWICDAFGTPTSNSPLTLSETVLRYNSNAQDSQPESFPFTIPLIRSDSDIPNTHENIPDNLAAFNPKFYLDPIAVDHRSGRFSATQLLKFKQCPTKYYLGSILGMPEEPKLSYDLADDEDSEKVRGPLLGQIVHKLLEHIDSIAHEGILDDAAFEHKIKTVFDALEIYDPRERAEYKHTAHHHITTFLTSAVAGIVLSNQNTRTEFPVQALLPSGDTLFGIIDRLFQDQNSTWTILDYKTDANPNSKNSDRYQFQLLFYSYLVRLLHPDAENIRAILFYTSTGESRDFRFSSADFDQFAAESSAIISQIRALEYVPDLGVIPRNTDHCPECRFFDQISKQCIALSSNAQNPSSTPAI